MRALADPARPLSPLLPGELIAGYTIESVIARGGMGVVYRAHQAELGRSVALKVIAAEHAGHAVFRARFVQEARLAASLDHPNVIPIFEAGDDGGRLFIAMRLVEGSDLERLIAARGPLAPELAVRLIEQAAAGLDAAHARGLVHRDVKPANILLAGPADDPHVYVSDFGVAKSLAPGRPLTSASEWIGTAGYAAPEQAEAGPLDARADVYALGCVLFAALRGHPPFHDGPVPGGAGIPAALDEVLARALARRPDDRFPSAGALAAAARRALDGGPVAPRRALAAPAAGAPTLAAPTRVTLAPGRRPGRAAVATAAAVLVAAAVVAVLAIGGNGSGRRAATHAGAGAAGAAAGAAAGDGDTVVCHPASCTQGGRTVATPIEGGACSRRGSAATWTRIDRHAPEPMLICLPARGSPGAAAPAVPTLTGAQLDRAELALDRLGVGHETSGGGLLGIIDRGNWTVCAVNPPAGTVPAAGSKVRLFVDHSC